MYVLERERLHSPRPRLFVKFFMKRFLPAALIALLIAVILLLIVYMLYAMHGSPSIRILNEREEQQIRDIRFYGAVKQAFALLIPGGLLLCGIVVSIGFSRRRAVFMARIGEHSELPVHYSQIRRGALAQQLTALVTAEQLKQSNAGIDKAMALYVTLADMQVKALRAAPVHALPAAAPAIIDAPAAAAPSFADLLRSGDIAPGRPLIFGFANAAPQYRQLTDIKAMSIAGFQGSGKTLSTAYLVTCGLLQFPSASAMIIDPHGQHEEGLASLLRPLAGERLRVVNPFEIGETMDSLTAQLDARLTGRESSAAPVFLVIDELAQIGRADVFKTKVFPFLERCTEETRKANMLFLGCSTKWNAKHFCGCADFRAAIPSLLIHKTKPSQADLLLEGAKERNLVKQISRPGQALLATSHDADPQIVTMPLITRQDIAAVKEQVNGRSIDRTEVKPVDLSKSGGLTALDRANSRIKNGEITQKSLAAALEVDEGFLSKILRGVKPLPERIRQKMEAL